MTVFFKMKTRISLMIHSFFKVMLIHGSDDSELLTVRPHLNKSLFDEHLLSDFQQQNSQANQNASPESKDYLSIYSMNDNNTKTVTNKSLCSVENIPKTNLTMNTDDIRRYSPSDDIYDIARKLSYVRPVPNPNDKRDCLRHDRKRIRHAPYTCYSDEFGSWNWSREMTPFFNEIMNDFRFCFDYVLFDPTFGTRNEYNFWFLIYYLRTLVKDVLDPAQIINSIRGKNKYYCTPADVREFEKAIVDAEHEIQQKIGDTVTGVYDFATTMGAAVIGGLGDKESKEPKKEKLRR